MKMVAVVISIVLMLAMVPLFVMVFLSLSRITKKLREKDGEAVLRENRRLVAVWPALWVCYMAGRGLFDYGTKENVSILWCLINSGIKNVLFAVSRGVAYHMIRKGGMALQEENQSN